MSLKLLLLGTTLGGAFANVPTPPSVPPSYYTDESFAAAWCAGTDETLRADPDGLERLQQCVWTLEQFTRQDAWTFEQFTKQDEHPETGVATTWKYDFPSIDLPAARGLVAARSYEAYQYFSSIDHPLYHLSVSLAFNLLLPGWLQFPANLLFVAFSTGITTGDELKDIVTKLSRAMLLHGGNAASNLLLRRIKATAPMKGLVLYLNQRTMNLDWMTEDYLAEERQQFTMALGQRMFGHTSASLALPEGSAKWVLTRTLAPIQGWYDAQGVVRSAASKAVEFVGANIPFGVFLHAFQIYTKHGNITWEEALAITYDALGYGLTAWANRGESDPLQRAKNKASFYVLYDRNILSYLKSLSAEEIYALGAATLAAGVTAYNVIKRIRARLGLGERYERYQLWTQVPTLPPEGRREHAAYLIKKYHLRMAAALAAVPVAWLAAPPISDVWRAARDLALPAEAVAATGLALAAFRRYRADFPTDLSTLPRLKDAEGRFSALTRAVGAAARTVVDAVALPKILEFMDANREPLAVLVYATAALLTVADAQGQRSVFAAFERTSVDVEHVGRSLLAEPDVESVRRALRFVRSDVQDIAIVASASMIFAGLAGLVAPRPKLEAPAPPVAERSGLGGLLAAARVEDGALFMNDQRRDKAKAVKYLTTIYESERTKEHRPRIAELLKELRQAP